MNSNVDTIAPFLEKALNFGNSKVELWKLKFLDNFSDIISMFVARFLIAIIFLIFLLFLSVSVAIWLGVIFGKSYYGFLAVSSFYGVVSFIIWLRYKSIKMKANNWIINKMLN
jgi:hypothetical protein